MPLVVVEEPWQDRHTLAVNIFVWSALYYLKVLILMHTICVAIIIKLYITFVYKYILSYIMHDMCVGCIICCSSYYNRKRIQLFEEQSASGFFENFEI